MATHSVTQNDDVDDGGWVDGGGWVSFFGKSHAAGNGKNPQSNLFIARGCRSYARRGKSVLNNFRALV